MKKIDESKIFYIHEDYVTLGQALKHFRLISTGGEAKIFLEENKVYVNDEIESRRGRKLHDGDVIENDNEIYKICLSKD